MARRDGFFSRIARLLGFGSPEPEQKTPSEPIMQPRPTTGPTAKPAAKAINLPLSDHSYHVILAGHGPVWFRPYIGQDDYNAKGYVINMQGFLRGGTRNHGIGYYESELSDLGDYQVSGVLDDGTEIHEAEFVTDAGTIEYYGSIEPLTGDGWKSE